MADNTELNAGSGGDTISTDDLGTVKVQRVKIQYGTDGVATDVSDTNPLPIDDAGGSITVDGTVTADAGTGPWPVTDNGGSLTVDNAALSVTGGGVEASALRVTLANDSTGVLSVDDNGGSLTIDGTVTANLSATDNAVLDSIDAAVNGTLTVDLGANNDVTIEGGAVLGTSGSAGPANALSIGGTESGGTFRELAVDSNGYLQVEVVGFPNGQTDDAAFTPATDSVSMIGCTFDDTTPDSVDEGDGGAVRMSANRSMYVQLRDAAGNERGVNIDANNNLQVIAASNDGVDIGDVDVASVIPGTGATNLGKAIDSAAGATDTGVAPLAIRDDTLSALTPAEGDWTPLRVNSTGALHVTGGGGGTEYTEDDAAAANPVGNASILVRADTPATITSTDGDNVAQRGTDYGAAFCQIVDSSGNFVDSFGGSGGTAAADDADFTAGTTQGTPAMGVYESSPTSVTDGDLGVVGISSDRRLLVDAQIAGQDADVTIADGGNSITVDGTVTANAGTGPWPVTDNGGSLTVDGTVTVSSISTSITPGTGATNLGKAEDAAHATGDVGVMALAVRTGTPANRSGTDGDYEPLQMSAGRLWTSSTITAHTPGTAAGNLGKAEDAAHASGDTGVAMLAVRRDAAAVGSGTDGDYSTLNVGELGHLRTGCVAESMYRNVDANAEASIKGSAGILHWIHVMNMTAAVAYVHLYNDTTGNVTPGTTTPTLTLPIPTLGDTNGAGFNLRIDQLFDTAITLVVTTTIDGSTGDPGTNGVFVNAGYT